MPLTVEEVGSPFETLLYEKAVALRTEHTVGADEWKVEATVKRVVALGLSLSLSKEDQRLVSAELLHGAAIPGSDREWSRYYDCF